MSHIAVWTDENERVQRKHYHPDDVDTSGAVVTEVNESRPNVEPWVSVTEYFNETDGFYYTTSDPLDGVSLTSQEETLLDYTKNNKSAEELMNYVNELAGAN